MNLIIDIGNTRTKCSVFNNNEEIFSDSFLDFESKELESILKSNPLIDKCILSATGHIPKGFIKMLNQSVKYCLEFDHNTPLPFASNYTTIHTIGLDRLAGVAGANVLLPEKDVLIIDAGTAITYDVKNKEGMHLGGNISPGMKMRFNALHNFTEKLPLVESKDEVSLIGKSTEEAILSGVIFGITTEIEGYINLLEENYRNLTIILTGGDAQFFVNRLKKTIFVLPNLVSTGLNTILSHNVATI